MPCLPTLLPPATPRPCILVTESTLSPFLHAGADIHRLRSHAGCLVLQRLAFCQDVVSGHEVSGTRGHNEYGAPVRQGVAVVRQPKGLHSDKYWRRGMAPMRLSCLALIAAAALLTLSQAVSSLSRSDTFVFVHIPKVGVLHGGLRNGEQEGASSRLMISSSHMGLTGAPPAFT